MVRAQRDFRDLDTAFQSVRRSLMNLQYRNPPIDPLEVSFDELTAALQETGTVPQGVDPMRYAAMVLWYARDPQQAKEV